VILTNLSDVTRAYQPTIHVAAGGSSKPNNILSTQVMQYCASGVQLMLVRLARCTWCDEIEPSSVVPTSSLEFYHRHRHQPSS
jgi:hypothetical protein